MVKEKFFKSLKGTSETETSKIKKEVSSNRWAIAQNSEKEYWNDYTKESLLKEEVERHFRKSKVLLNEWSKFIKINDNTKILQIGCGPEDVINYFPIGKKYAIDPLADFYKKKFELKYNVINFSKARGEEIPFEDDFFDIVILANVLDHVELPEKVLSEVERVLKKQGIFHFENLFYQRRFIYLSKFWGGFKKIFFGKIFNIHHPYMFTVQDLRNLILDKFLVIHEEIGREIAIYENIKELGKQKIKDKKLSVKIPAYFGLYGTINYSSICKK